MSVSEELLDKAQRLKYVVTARATNLAYDDGEYTALRRDLVGITRVRPKLPRFVIECPTLDEFWHFVRPKYAHYQERRAYIQSEFAPVLEMLELETSAPGDDVVTSTLSTVDSEHVRAAWEKAIERRRIDPDGAITSARTLLECVCKFVLDKNSVSYDDKADFPALYNSTANSLNIAPSQQTMQVMRQILGGCLNVVTGLGALRNKLSDAHGRGVSGVNATAQQAELAVNLAGAVALFLISTWESKHRGEIRRDRAMGKMTMTEFLTDPDFDEIRHLRLGAFHGEKTALGGTHCVIAKCHSDAGTVLVRCREVLEVILLRYYSEDEWPSDEEWRGLLPVWFVDAFVENDSAKWSLRGWMQFFDSIDRSWWWWDAYITDPDHLCVEIIVRGLPFGSGSLYWLLQASGAESVH